MDIDRPPKLRTPGSESGAATPPGGAGLGGPPPPINALAELVADLIAATGLVPADKLAMVRSAAGMGSFAHALVEQNVASSEGLARTLAARYQMPLVDLPLVGVSDEAGTAIPLHVLERLVAIPYALDDGTLRIAVADPGNIQGIDELRLATRYPLEIGVAARDDILVEIRRLARASEAFGARAAIEEELAEEEDETDDLEIEDGISDAPLVRLVNSVIFQAAEDGASDVHFEPQEDCAARPLPGRRRAARGAAHSEADDARRPDPPEGACEARHRRAPQAAGRPHLAERCRSRPHARRSCRDPADRRRRVASSCVCSTSRRRRRRSRSSACPTRCARARGLIRKPTGALLVTGPTGSGKSTTLYAALTEINRPEINIITVEDPVEYRLGGVNQVQINQKAGPDVRDGASLDPAIRPRRGDGR